MIFQIKLCLSQKDMSNFLTILIKLSIFRTIIIVGTGLIFHKNKNKIIMYLIDLFQHYLRALKVSEYRM